MGPYIVTRRNKFISNYEVYFSLKISNDIHALARGIHIYTVRYIYCLVLNVPSVYLLKKTFTTV